MGKVLWGVLGTASIAHGSVIPARKMAQDTQLYAIAGRKLFIFHCLTICIRNGLLRQSKKENMYFVRSQ